jgi:hypothetical protein
MAYSKFTTLVSGYTADLASMPRYPNRAEMASDGEYNEAARAQAAWFKTHYKSIRRAGICKPETCRKMVEQLGLKDKISAKAASFDQSGKGRHSFVTISL